MIIKISLGGIVMVISFMDICGIVCVYWVLYVVVFLFCVLFGVLEGFRF